MVIYLLLVNIAVIISYSLYYFSFRKLTFFQWNRVYLLGTTCFALLIPIGLFIDLSSFLKDDMILPMVNMHDYIYIPIYVQQTSSLYLVDVMKWMYLAGLLFSLAIVLWRLLCVKKMFKIDAPFLGFSFFNKMFLGKEVQFDSSIERHEQIHMDQGHSYDVLFMELFKAFNWFNPVVYHLSKEIKFQHECIADELSSEDKVAYAELLVAHALQVPQNILVHEFSNQSFLKKRIMMLFKNKSSKNKRFLYLGIIPALLVVGLSTIVFNTSRAKTVLNHIESKMDEVKLPTSDVSDQKLLVELDQLESNDKRSILLSDSVKAGGDELFIETEINPEPKGGMQAFRKWIGDNYQFPQAAIDAGVKGTIKTRFIVEKDGSLSDIKVLEDIGHGTGEAAIQLLKKSQKWLPAIQNGHKVRCEFTLPIRLDLTDDRSEKSSQDTIQGNFGGKITQLSNIGPVGNTVFESVEIQPEPPGGMAAYRKWIAENYKYPQHAINAKVKGIVSVSFIVEKDGSLSEINILKDLSYGTGDALVEVLKNSKQWSPGIQNGKPVRVAYFLPIRLDLTSSN